MHSDIHYFGTYAMARATGLRREVCQTIATAAQFVDANDKEYDIDFSDGGRLRVVPTAHPMVHIKNTTLFDRDQRMVWLPFHFLPGNEGDSLSERLICRQNSAIAREMVKHCLSMANKPFGLQLVGIAAHVYADTFSHYGFSGVSSRWNKVKGESIVLRDEVRDMAAEDRFRAKYGETMEGLENWRQTIWDRLRSGVAEGGTGALGHGAVMKYPDFPYLEWEFSYEHSEGEQRVSPRKNADTFLEACEKLYEVFSCLGPDYQDPEIDQSGGFDRIRDVVTEILRIRETDRDKRGAKWRSAAEEGTLFNESEEVLLNQGEAWKESLKSLHGGVKSDAASGLPVFQFFQAAAIYRSYVLRDLLPAHGLVLD
ncbi:MAG: hypothetical protein OXH76_07490 [Boseongicola sp.]|nr:hypothetical protein [Boseongicola sp.]